MFLVEEKNNGDRRAEIYMRSDGLFEGRIYRTTEGVSGPSPAAANDPEQHFEVCGVTETLPRVETIVDEELGL